MNTASAANDNGPRLQIRSVELALDRFREPLVAWEIP